MNNEDKKSTIMIVDDTPANLEILESLLRRHGYNVVAFTHGDLALRAVNKFPPDLILLDIMMPEIDGFNVCQKLKADEELKEIPVIFISASNDAADKVKAFSLGAVDYMNKPFNDQEVLARVKTHINLRKMQQELVKHNHHLENLVWEKIKEISDSQMSTLVAISNLAEYRDAETGQHIERCRILCRLLAEKLREHPHYAEGISEAFINNIYYAAPLHDIGKIGIPDGILLKPGKLTHNEFEVMKTHTTIGSKTLKKVEDMYPKNTFITMGIALAKSHHEKWNGTGYPEGIAGDNIPLSARIMALVDVYDALRSNRPYKKAFTHEKSIKIIQESSSQHFDPVVVDTFNSIESSFANIFEKLNDDGT